MYGLYFHCFTASAAARARLGSPLKTFTPEMSPFFEIVASNWTGPSTRIRNAVGGYEGVVFLITNPCETPCDTFIACRTGVGALVPPSIRLGSDPLSPAEAMPAILGIGASVEAVAAGAAAGLLTTIGCASAGASGVLFAATIEGPGLDKSAPAFTSLGCVVVPELLFAACGETVELFVVAGTDDGTEATDETGDEVAPEATDSETAVVAGREATLEVPFDAPFDAPFDIPFEGPNFEYAAYPPAAIRTMAATAISAFLLPPLFGSASLPTVPPKVNDGATNALPSTLSLAAIFSAGASGVETTAEDVSGTETLGFASRAGAGALAAPVDRATETPGFEGTTTSGLLTLGLDSTAAASIFTAGAELAAGTCFGATEMDSLDSADSLTALEADAATLGCITGFGVGMVGGATGTIGLAVGAATEGGTRLGGATSAGFATTGAAAAGLTAAGGVTVAGLLDSFLRKSPLATRNVPFACSTLIGFVRTRLAPMRKAFATPACPSTTATARAD